MAFEGWQNSKHFFDPITEERKAGSTWRGASRFVCWEIFSTITNMENLNATQNIVWRGQKDSTWRLMTNLQRYWEERNPGLALDTARFKKEKDHLYREALRRGIGRTEIGTARTLHTFTELQHYGVPTHLLDVTEDALTALWFACQPTRGQKDENGTNGEKDGILFAIDVSKMSFITTSHTEDELDKLTAQTKKVGTKTVTNLPIYLKSHVPNRRMSAQRGAFIVSGNPVGKNKPGFESFSIPPIKKFTDADAIGLRSAHLRSSGMPHTIPFVAILVPSECKKWILSKLESGNKRSEESLFPDVLGLAKKYESQRLLRLNI